jgi:hypothetical protein
MLIEIESAFFRLLLHPAINKAITNMTIVREMTLRVIDPPLVNGEVSVAGHGNRNPRAGSGRRQRRRPGDDYGWVQSNTQFWDRYSLLPHPLPCEPELATATIGNERHQSNEMEPSSTRKWLSSGLSAMCSTTQIPEVKHWFPCTLKRFSFGNSGGIIRQLAKHDNL